MFRANGILQLSKSYSICLVALLLWCNSVVSVFGEHTTRVFRSGIQHSLYELNGIFTTQICDFVSRLITMCDGMCDVTICDVLLLVLEASSL